MFETYTKTLIAMDKKVIDDNKGFEMVIEILKNPLLSPKDVKPIQWELKAFIFWLRWVCSFKFEENLFPSIAV